MYDPELQLHWVLYLSIIIFQMNLSPIIWVQRQLNGWVLFVWLGNNFVDPYLFNIQHLGSQMHINNDHCITTEEQGYGHAFQTSQTP